MKTIILSLATAIAVAAPAKPPAYSTYTATVTATCEGAGCSGQESKGTQAFSANQNKSAWLPAKNGGAGIPTVADFNQKAVYFLTGPPAEPCGYYCPLASVDTICSSNAVLNAFCNYDYKNKIKFVDSADGVDHYHVNSGIGPLTLAQYDYYMDSKSEHPVKMQFLAQPFGKVIGNITTYYNTFDVADPEPSLFAVGDTKYCEKGDDSQCSDVNIARALRGF